MSMISEQINGLEKIKERLETDSELDMDILHIADFWAKDIGKAIYTIQALSSKVSENQGGWIPCNEQLPEESLNSVIGWDEYRKRCCFVQYYDGRWILGNDADSVKIVAWQPLPQPYGGIANGV